MNQRITARRLCSLAILTALTLVLAVFATFRIGNQIKIPMKFITVFITGALYGPLAGGLVAAAADILNAVLVPVGPPLLQITAVEFIYGFTYGLFFFNAWEKKGYFLRAAGCSLLHFAIGIFITSALLTQVGYFASFQSAVIIRLPAAIVTLIIHITGICSVKKLLFIMKKRGQQ